MREGALASGLSEATVLLCGPCADAYDSRRESAGCASCGAALRQDIKLPPTYSNVEQLADLLPTYCPTCSVGALASITAAAANAAADTAAAPLRAEVARLNDELALARAAVPQRRVAGHPLGPDGIAPATDRCGALFASFVLG